MTKAKARIILPPCQRDAARYSRYSDSCDSQHSLYSSCLLLDVLLRRTFSYEFQPTVSKFSYTKRLNSYPITMQISLRCRTKKNKIKARQSKTQCLFLLLSRNACSASRSSAMQMNGRTENVGVENAIRAKLQG